jgi:hypothetical protein
MSAKAIIIGAIFSLVAVIWCVIAFRYWPDDPLFGTKSPVAWQAPLPLKIGRVEDLPEMNIEISPRSEFANIVPNTDPKSQFVRFTGAYLRSDRKGWRYEVEVQWLRKIVVNRIIINRDPSCGVENHIGYKSEGFQEEIRNYCTGPGKTPFPEILFHATTTTPIPIHEVTLETDLGTFSYDTRGLTLREQNSK